MSTENNDKKNWLEKLTDRYNAVVMKFDLPEDMHHEIETFMLTIAKEQYLAGSKSGITWLRKQVGAKPGQLLAAVDAPPQTA